jgi:hypothetical protein
MSNIVKNIEYDILTPSGYSNFKGISMKEVGVLFNIEFSDGSNLSCTENHLIKLTNTDFLEACHLQIGDELENGILVENISYEIGKFYVFDPIDVEMYNEYYSNSVISHNCAFIPNVEDIWISSQQTLATGGGAIILSTPNGVGNFFHQLWVESESKTNSRFHQIKLPWTVHPDRDQSWRDKQDDLLGIRGARQECDASFEGTGHTVIEGELLAWYRKTTVQDPISKQGFDGNLWIWEHPDYTKDYIVVADVARGDGGDYSGAHVLDVESMVQVAEYKGQISPKDYGNLLVNLATQYNDALLVIENANIGWTTIQVAIDRGYKNLYYSTKDSSVSDVSQQLSRYVDLKDTSQMVAGFTTSSRTRPLVISKLDTYMRERTPVIRSSRLMDELDVFIWNGSKAEAMRGYNDDLVMSFCIALWIRDTALRLRQQGIEVQRKTLDYFGKSSGVYNGRSGMLKDSGWSMNVKNNGKGNIGVEDLTWLL